VRSLDIIHMKHFIHLRLYSSRDRVYKWANMLICLHKLKQWAVLFYSWNYQTKHAIHNTFNMRNHNTRVCTIFQTCVHLNIVLLEKRFKLSLFSLENCCLKQTSFLCVHAFLQLYFMISFKLTKVIRYTDQYIISYSKPCIAKTIEREIQAGFSVTRRVKY